DWAEDFFLDDLHVRGDAGEDSRLYIITAVEPLGPATATGDARALGASGSNVALYTCALARHGQWPHLRCRIERVADLDVGDRSQIEIEELLFAPLGHENTGQREADLAGDRHRVGHQARQRSRKIGVLEQHRRGLSAKFEADPRQALGADR